MAHLSFSSFPLAQQTTPAQLAPLPSRGPSNRQSGPVHPASLAMAQPRARSASTSPRHAWPHLPAPPRTRPAQRRTRVPLSRCVPGPHATRLAHPTCRSHPPAAPRSRLARPTPPVSARATRSPPLTSRPHPSSAPSPPFLPPRRETEPPRSPASSPGSLSRCAPPRSPDPSYNWALRPSLPHPRPTTPRPNHQHRRIPPPGPPPPVSVLATAFLAASGPGAPLTP